MRYFKRFITVVLFCAVGALAVFFYVRPNSDQTGRFLQKKAGLQRLIKNAADLHRLWREGEESREWSLLKDQCLKDWGINAAFDESLLRCRPQLIECYAKYSKNLDYKILNDEQSSRKYRYLTKSNVSHWGLRGAGISVTLEDNVSQERLDLFLSDQCHEVYLEQRAYAYGEPPENRSQPDYRFDNFNQHIYLDRHLVTNAQVNEWIVFGPPNFTKGLRLKNQGDLFLPAIDLSLAQMENFCSFQGKQLLSAHYFDAATFLPMDLNEPIPAENLRSPYYWTKKKSEFRTDCKLLFAQECLESGQFALNQSDPSWAGLLDSMGGVLEVFRNPIDPDSNLRASSFYFPFKSEWHKLGFRAQWDGKGHALANFDFRGLNPEGKMDNFQVGFRCMRGVLP